MLNQYSEEILDEISRYIVSKYIEFSKSEARKKKLEAIRNARKAYKQEPKEQNWPWKNASNLVVPLTAITVDQLEPRLVASLIGRDEMIALDDLGRLDKEVTNKIASFDNAVLKNDVRIFENIPRWIHTILVDGQIYLQPYWAYRDVKTRQYINNPLTGLPETAQDGDPDAIGGFKTQEVVTTIVDGVRIAEVPLETLFFPDFIDDWEKAPIIRKIWISVADLRQNISNKYPGWVDLSPEELEEIESKAYHKRPSDDSDDMLSERVSEEEKVKELSTGAQLLKAEILALEGHISYDIDEDGEEENLICIIEYHTGKILRLVNNNTIDPLNRKQIQPWYIIRDENTGYGVSIHEKVKEIERGSSVLFNMLINSAMIQMIPWFFYEVGAGFSGQVIELIPGRGQPINDISKLFFPSINPTAAAFKDFLTIFLGLWERITSVSDYNAGRQSEITRTRSTATGTLALIQESQILHEYMGTRLQSSFTKIIEIIHDLYYLNATDDLIVGIIGETIPRVLSKNYIFKLTASTKSANRHIERQELAEALQVAQQGIQLGIINPVAVVRDWLKTFKDIDVEEWMDTPVNAVVQRLTNAGQSDVYDPFPQIVTALAQMDPLTLTNNLNKMMGQVQAEQVPEGQ